MTIEHFKSHYKLKDKDFVLFPYGSRVYGTFGANSDYDYQCVIYRNDTKTGEEYRHGGYNIHIYSKLDWQKQLDNHKINILEAYFLPDGICGKRFNFNLDLKKLRSAISEKASHSFVKAKKKIEKEGDYYVGWKSLFHSLRILIFGRQIAVDGKISDYGAANHYWHSILNNPRYDWKLLEEEYKPIYNELATEFRKVAPIL